MINKKIAVIALVMSLTISGAVTNQVKGSEVENANVQWITMAQNFMRPMSKGKTAVGSFPAMRSRNPFHTWKPYLSESVLAPVWMKFHNDESEGTRRSETQNNAKKIFKARLKADSARIRKSETVKNDGKPSQNTRKVAPTEITKPETTKNVDKETQETPIVVPEKTVLPEANNNTERPKEHIPVVVPEEIIKPDTNEHAEKPSQDTPKEVPEVITAPEPEKTEKPIQDTPKVVPEQIEKPVTSENDVKVPQADPKTEPAKISKGTILQMTTTAENSTTTLQYNYAENFRDGRGITFGIIGFTTGTYDGNILIKHYTTLNPNNNLARFIPALDAIDRLPHNGNDGDSNNSTVGLDGFIEAVQNNTDPLFRKAQHDKLDELYWNPAVNLFNSIGAKNPITQAFLYDMTVNHGYSGAKNFVSKATSALGGTPGEGIDENTYLIKLMDLRETYLRNTNNPGIDRVAAFRRVLATGNVNLITPFNFTVYGDTFKIDGNVY